MNPSPNALTWMKPVILSNGNAAGTSDITFTTLDLSTGNFESVMLVVHLGAVVDAATLRLRAYTCSDSGGSNPDLIDDVTGAEGQTAEITAASSSNKLMILVIHKPKTPYISFVLERGAQNATVQSAIAYQYGSRGAPVTQGSDVLASALGLCY